ncbi:MAG: hypothetical protein R3F40_18540 [Candidatus Competibacteraceae bacterium]
MNTMPFARPHFKDVLMALDFIVKNDYPARGEADRTPVSRFPGALPLAGKTRMAWSVAGVFLQLHGHDAIIRPGGPALRILRRRRE